MNRPQFRLKTIFFAMFIVAVGSLAAAREIYLHRQVDRTFAAGRRFGAHGFGYTFDTWPWPSAAIRLDFSGSNSLDDEALKAIADFPIDEIDLTASHISDKAVEAFRKARPSAVVKR